VGFNVDFVYYFSEFETFPLNYEKQTLTMEHHFQNDRVWDITCRRLHWGSGEFLFLKQETVRRQNVNPGLSGAASEFIRIAYHKGDAIIFFVLPACLSTK